MTGKDLSVVHDALAWAYAVEQQRVVAASVAESGPHAAPEPSRFQQLLWRAQRIVANEIENIGQERLPL